MESQPFLPSLLRAVPLYAFPISVALSLPYAIALGGLTPAIGLIFLAASCSISLRNFPKIVRHLFGPKYEYRIVLGNDSESRLENGQKPRPSKLLTLADLVLAFFHAVLFSMSIVEMALGPSWYCNHSEILGTFASMPYLAVL